MKIKRILFIGTFLLYIYGFFFLQIFAQDRSFSEVENRVLQKLPEFSFTDLVEDRYTKDFENYLQDQFPERDELVAMKSYLDMKAGKKDNGGVFLGEDGYLLEKFEHPDMELLKRNMSYINALGKHMKTYFMLIPTSIKINEEKLPDYAVTEDEQKYILEALKLADGKIIAVPAFEALINAKGALFYRTDHHWTTFGAFKGYEAFMKAAGLKPDKMEDYTITSTPDFLGSLYSKGNFTFLKGETLEVFKRKAKEKLKITFLADNTTTDSLYQLENLKEKDKYKVFLGGNHPIVKIETGVKNGKKLMIVKDSFANALVPFLTNQYEEIHVLDVRFLNMNVRDYAESCGISEALILYNVQGFAKEQALSHLQ